MRTTLSAAAFVALLLAACTPEKAADSAETGSGQGRAELGEGAGPGAVAPAEPTGNIDVAEPDARDTDQGNEASAPDAPATVIPARYHGEWSAEPAACGRSHETRLRIAADQLRFHESTGTVQAVRPGGPGTIEVTATYSGEGESWTNVRRLTLSEDGDALSVTGEGATLTRSRCP